MRFVLLLVLAASSACSLFTSFDDLDEERTGDPDASADGAPAATVDAGGDSSTTTDTGTPNDPPADAAVDTGADAGYPNLHPNGAMEFSCQGWFGYNATLASSATAHGGSASCMVCGTVTASDVETIDEGGAVLNPVTGGVYVASAWFRVPDGKSPPPSGVKMVFNATDSNSQSLEYQQTPSTAIDLTWKKLSVQLTVTKSAAKLRIWAGGKAEAGTCFLIDDVRVERWQ